MSFVATTTIPDAAVGLALAPVTLFRSWSLASCMTMVPLPDANEIEPIGVVFWVIEPPDESSVSRTRTSPAGSSTMTIGRV